MLCFLLWLRLTAAFLTFICHVSSPPHLHTFSFTRTERHANLSPVELLLQSSLPLSTNSHLFEGSELTFVLLNINYRIVTWLILHKIQLPYLKVLTMWSSVKSETVNIESKLGMPSPNLLLVSSEMNQCKGNMYHFDSWCSPIFKSRWFFFRR